jgi:hypothetical protein
MVTTTTNQLKEAMTPWKNHPTLAFKNIIYCNFNFNFIYSIRKKLTLIIKVIEDFTHDLFLIVKLKTKK